jgi:proteasome lid subunit RPN8/RPN11
MMSNTVYLPVPVRAQLESWAEAGYPLETCGVLVGRQTEGQIHVSRAVPARNVNSERTHDRYELAAEDFLAADLAAQAEGLEIVGIWHSHPDHPAQPSETDRMGAWQDWSYIILSVRQGRAVELRAWRLTGEAFVEERVTAWQR